MCYNTALTTRGQSTGGTSSRAEKDVDKKENDCLSIFRVEVDFTSVV